MASLAVFAGSGCATPAKWVGVWSTAPIEEAADRELASGREVVLRQVVRISDGSERVRLRLSNEYGAEPLVVEDVRVAVAGPGGSIAPRTDRPVLFSGGPRVSIPAGSERYSDALAFAATADSDLAVTARLVGLPSRLAGHPGSRATSYVKVDAGTADERLEGATRIVHWYVLSGIEANRGRAARAAIVCLGDSITDGHGCPPDTNSRWTDALSRRLRAVPATRDISVLNLGIGGGRLLRPGIGPAGLARLSRDVYGQAGARWVIVELGVNDLGARIKAQAAGQAFASAQDLIAGYQKVVSGCREHHVRVALATITPFAGATWYSTPEIERDRQVVNRWIRQAGSCDRVVDFDAALRDSEHPTLLLPSYDSGDHLHPSMAGYRRMAESVPIDFLAPAQTLEN